ncbi:transposase [Lysinibacillus fusiformis]|uniref:transposase n=1 Tax=Lysinibacillus TaxID=400634 RepID=UPI001B8CE95C
MSSNLCAPYALREPSSHLNKVVQNCCHSNSLFSVWAWGYFCATVGTVTEEIIRNYIANQFEEKNGIFNIQCA